MKLFIGIALALLSAAYANELTICDGIANGIFIPDVSRCNGWFSCPGAVSGTCPDPWLFNPTTRECDWQQNVQCFSGCSLTTPIHSLPVNGSCTQFIRCISGRATQDVCQNGLHFNPQTEQCDLPENVGCTIQFSCPPNIPPGQMVSFRSPTNCSEFTVCTAQGNPIQQACNQVLHFDPVTQQCTHPNMTDCPLGDDTVTTVDPGLPPTTTTTTTTQAPFTCPSDGHHRHPTACNQFIVCAAGTPHFFTCSEGLHFNAATRQCDLPSNAQCT